MYKNTKKLIGQPILAQILSHIPAELIESSVHKHQSNRYYKSIPFRAHLISLLYGVFSYCNGLREICEGMLACEGKLNHLGLNKAIAKSTLSDANRNRSYLVFESLYFSLVRHYTGFISDSRLRGLSIRNLKIIDSTTICLFSDILKGVGRKPVDGSRKKGGIKVHALMNAFSGIVDFVRITAGKEQDIKFLHHLELAKNSFIVFDRGYMQYLQFAKWSKQKVWFVTRMKERCVFTVNKVITDKSKKKNKSPGIIKEQLITVEYKDDAKKRKQLSLRRITYLAEDKKEYVFITNNFNLKAGQIALIYKSRWMIELLFKQIKQNFPLRYFWGENQNAVKMQVYCVLIAQLIMVVIRKKSMTKKSFANMITVIRLHLISYVDLLAFIKDTYVAWKKANPPPLLIQA